MSEPIRVAVLGARGRMGQEVCLAVDNAADLHLAAMIDEGDWLPGVLDAGAELVVDFTHPDVVMDNLRFALDNGLHAVIGTTGFTEQRLATVADWLVERRELGVLIAANFGIGAVLSVKFAQLAAQVGGDRHADRREAERDQQRRRYQQQPPGRQDQPHRQHHQHETGRVQPAPAQRPADLAECHVHRSERGGQHPVIELGELQLVEHVHRRIRDRTVHGRGRQQRRRDVLGVGQRPSGAWTPPTSAPSPVPKDSR
ncbi:MAG: hypothetical protein ABI418_10160 [Jatrophihabitantaceae bacterium]